MQILLQSIYKEGSHGMLQSCEIQMWQIRHLVKLILPKLKIYQARLVMWNAVMFEHHLMCHKV